MWLYRLKRLLAEREVLIGLGIFGIAVMVADLFNDLNWSVAAAVTRGVGLLLLMLLLVWEFVLRPRLRQPVPVPLVFTEERDRAKARAIFNAFVESMGLTKAVRVLEELSPLERNDFLIRLDRTNPRDSSQPDDWQKAWEELLHEWEREVDRRLTDEPFVGEGRCYHIFPHIVLPLSFALGASVGLRRSMVLYHHQPDRYYRVLDLTEPRCLFRDPDPAIPPPQCIPQDLDTLPEVPRLILHLAISERHSVAFENHPDHEQAANAALMYQQTLNPEEDWLPYVQWFWQKANPLMARYPHVDLCLKSPSVIAFALGMAFSRTSHITVCHWLENQYVPVFPLSLIERRLPFD